MTFWSELIHAARRRRGVTRAPGVGETEPARHDDRAPPPPANEGVVAPAVARAVAHDVASADAAVAIPPGAWHPGLLDLMTEGLLVVGADGAVTYRNAAVQTLAETGGEELLRVARALGMSVLARAGTPPAAAPAVSHHLTVDTVRFQLRASLAPAHRQDAGAAAAVVTIARIAPPFPSIATLRHQFQLTTREATVALLLAEGRSNAAISRRLGISGNTVRHYTETVLLKLDVPSRASVAAALLGIYERTDEHAATSARRPPHPPRAD